MISWFFIISGIAVFFYILVPLASSRLLEKSNETIRERLLIPAVFAATVSGTSRGMLYVNPANTGQNLTDEEERILLPSGKTLFFQLFHDGTLNLMSWRDITAVKKGSTVMIYLPDAGYRKAICVFHEERNGSGYQARLRKAILDRDIMVKPFSIATGVLLEFMILLHALHDPHLTTVALFALIAIFGKALPYCPPGLLLTHVGHRITVRASEDKKKGRQRGTVGILIYSAGILLNIALLFFIISNTGLAGYIN